ncbi:cobalt-precorrin-6A reductase [Clostridium sp. Sa3CUN1]|uniref:Cobalt-precorrin-6A reductase n=1 Tax=Clostridium gallinarum TaxID=2762246 RepID=A0ABR8Q4D1_9CLOT|nr:cobalt-precorrin-6A reductase [Clostridium gallinarum]MBD7915270.1 cobalt-precorrin-6A reductase [Clostridium gallinarum]
MIGFVLGTSEGNEILEKVNKITDNIVISTATNYGGELLKKYKFKHLNTQPLDEEGFKRLIKEFNIKLFVDASHPYAKEVSKTLIKACEDLNIEYIRYERKSYLDNIENKNIIRVDNYEELPKVLENIEGNVLNTTGSNNAGFINSLEIKNRVIHRVLPLPNILQKLIDSGIKIENIVAIKGPFGKEINNGIIKEYEIKAIITKDSGLEGGMKEKIDSALENNINVIVISKPKIKYKNFYETIDDLIEVIENKKELIIR